MNKAKLKAYAPQARKDFIAAVTARANQLGLTFNKSELAIAPATRQGDVTLIVSREWPANVYTQRENLIKRMQREGFEQVVEAIAYTWFNRFAALRYMELHDYLGHGYRVLSSTAEGAGVHTPDILLHAVDLAQSQALPGLKADSVNQLKLAGNQDAELYRRLLIAQCNALSNAMPFLFERIDDETELLLPDNLLRTDSVIANLVKEIPEEDWQQVEIVGWLYQFYISEKKDQVIGKVVKSEDIPAATQLFTPNWIVQYLVQNSVGRLWMMANPQSTLKSQWPYYIEPAEQTAEVNAQLDALIKTRMDEDGGSLNPETITVLDPACGSGHILVEAYELLKGIYLERGYRLRDIPRLILEKNLYGLDIDDRAAQMAGFALMMKARADDRRLLEEPITLNVLSLQESKGLPQSEIAVALAPYGVSADLVNALLSTFEHAKTFGSLIQIPESLNEQLPPLADALSKATKTGDLYAHQAANDMLPLVRQGLLLGRLYDAVIANPPYMGSKSFNVKLKEWLSQNFPSNDKDLFASFIKRISGLTNRSGFYGIMTSFTWMFIASFESLRRNIVESETIGSLIQLHYDAFVDAKAHICTFVNSPMKTKGFKSTYVRLADFPGVDDQEIKTKEAINNRECGWLYVVDQHSFSIIPGSPIAYWLSDTSTFAGKKIGDSFLSGGRTKTHNNTKYLRYWWEVDVNSKKWNWYATSGDFRKFYGNLLNVVDWSDEARNFYASNGGLYPNEYWGKEGITWGKITSTRVSFRIKPAAAHYDSGAGIIFSTDFICDKFILAYLNSDLVHGFIQALNPTVNTTVSDIFSLPLPLAESDQRDFISSNTEELIDLSKSDWDSFERSMDFTGSPFVSFSDSLPSAYVKWRERCSQLAERMYILENENNKYFSNGSSFQCSYSSSSISSQTTVDANPRYRYGDSCSEDEINIRLLKDTSAEFVSYFVGCVMGRYSLDEPGLVYSHSGNIDFDSSKYRSFSADSDGILPVTNELWFDDDAALRFKEFLIAVWGEQSLNESIAWLVESLGKKESESSEETIRRYLADKFYKDHLQTYKKRPIYWLFSSGKQGAFQALVYLHRYHEGTLARMRAEYVVPLTGKIQARIDLLQKDSESAASTSARNKINKEIEKLRKQHVELLAYDEKLRHYADMRIKLDLDDGVKVNYGKFGDLLAEVKVVTGGAGDD